MMTENEIITLAHSCAHDAIAADFGAGLIRVSDPLPGDWDALRETLGRAPTREEVAAFSRVYRETLEEAGVQE